MRAGRTFVLASLAAAVGGSVSGCSFEITGLVPSDVRDGDSMSGDDATVPIDAEPDAIVLGAWGTPVPVGLTPPDSGEDDGTLTGDLLELYLNRTGTGGSDIFRATRTDATSAWGTPAIVTQLSSASAETTPEISTDGLRMVFASDRPGGTGNTDIWMSTRANRAAPWGTPAVVAALNTATSEAGGASPDGLTIVFSSFRKSNTSPDLYLAERATLAATWGTPTELAALNTTGHDGSPFLSNDKLAIYFDSDRGGSMDIYVSTRASVTDAFGAPVPVEGLATSANEQDPWLSPDGRQLYFQCDCGGPTGLWRVSR